MTNEELEYLNKYKPKLLQGHGDSALYQTRWGARTIANALEMQELERRYFARIAQQREESPVKMEVSEQLMKQHLDCVEKYGCGIFEGWY